VSAPHAVADLLRRRGRRGRGWRAGTGGRGSRPPANSPRVSRLESDAGVVREGLEAGRESALAVLRPLAA